MTKTNGRAALGRAIALALITLIVAFGGAVAARGVIAPDERTSARALADAARQAFEKGDPATGAVMLERARVLAPRDRVVRDALAAARLEDPRSTVDRAFLQVSPAEWLAVGSAAAWLAGAALVFVGIGRPYRSARIVGAAGVALVAFSACGMQRWRATETVVVSAGGTNALQAPFAEAPPTAPIAAGTPVMRQGVHGAFVRVRSGDAIEGWVPASALRPVMRWTS